MREISLNILDIIQNSIAANATLIYTTLEITGDILTLTISDNGKGMDEQTRLAVQDPFTTSRTTRSVGLGIPLLTMAARQTGGSVDIWSQQSFGTKVTAEFNIKNIDCMPMGDLGEVALLIICANQNIDFVFKVCASNRQSIVDTRQIKAILGDVPLDNIQVRQFLKDYLKENITDIYGGLI